MNGDGSPKPAVTRPGGLAVAPGHPNVLALLTGTDVEQLLTLEKLRRVLAYPVWGYIQRAVISTRSYDHAYTAAVAMLVYLEEHQGDVDAREFEALWTRLALFLLEMLDRSDRWAEYLELWRQIRRNTAFWTTYSADSRAFHGPEFEAYILGEEGSTLHVHFLWYRSHRREIVGRKLARRRAGRSTRHLRHASAEDLSADEVARRLAWVVELAEAAIARHRGGG